MSLNLIKVVCNKLAVIIILKSERLKGFPGKSARTKEYPLLMLLFHKALVGLARAT